MVEVLFLFIFFRCVGRLFSFKGEAQRVYHLKLGFEHSVMEFRKVVLAVDQFAVNINFMEPQALHFLVLDVHFL